MDINPTLYHKFCQLLQDEVGIVLGDSRQYLVLSRIQALLDDHYRTVDEALSVVVERPESELAKRAIDLMTTNETSWFRDRYPFDCLAEDILPALAERQSSLTLWSAACSQGQEPYSIAMVCKQFQQQHGAFSNGIRILATDYSQRCIDFAANAVYDRFMVERGMSSELKERWLSAVDSERFQVKPELQRMVTFRQFNLLTSYQQLPAFDVVFFRNVLIYFSRESKEDILNRVATVLKPGGALFLGATETVAGLRTNFAMVRTAHGIHYQDKTSIKAI